jgi:DNA invertase Pin-like site-specific DNA recombinase
MTQILLKAIAYARVSTRQQSRLGGSLDGQLSEIREFAKARNMKIGKTFTDDESARNEERGIERQGFQNATALALKKQWPIIVVEMSRFTRTEKTYADFVDNGGKIFSVEGFGGDEAEMRARAWRAERDGNRRSKATRAGQAKFVAAGGKLGGPDTEKARAASLAVRSARARIRANEFEREYAKANKAGCSRPKDAAKFLNESGFPTPYGQPWTEATVRKRLKALNAIRVSHAADLAVVDSVAEVPMHDDVRKLSDAERRLLLNYLSLTGKTSERAEELVDIIGRAPWSPKHRAKIEQLIAKASEKVLQEEREVSEAVEAENAISVKEPAKWGIF